MLEIKNLHAEVEGKKILQGISLAVKPGEVHAIMGPNGSGKSTLASVLAGRDGYQVTAGSVRYLGRDLLALAPDERAREGIFLAFQYPVEIPGVNNTYFLRAALNALRDPSRGIVVITHYQRLLDYIVPDHVHVLAYGEIRRSGTKDLAHELEAGGYAGVLGAEFAEQRAGA